MFSIGRTFTQSASLHDDYAKTESTNQVAVDSLTTGSAETVFGDDGTVQISAETIRLLKDATYRAAKYPSAYDLTIVPALLEKGDLPFALWTLMNLLPSKEKEVRTITFMLADRGIQGSDYLNAFYTYAFTDPDVVVFPVGQAPFLQNPKRLEDKLESCKTLAVYTEKYRKLKSEEK
jgi:hypothetical protein